MKEIKTQSQIGFCLYILLAALLLTNHSHFYDDEIWNINILLNYSTLFEIVNHIQSIDVHPPLSYVLNKLSYELIGDFRYIAVFPILLSALSLKYFYLHAAKFVNTNYSRYFLFVVTFVNSGFLLWTTSIRWYSYWVPLATFLLTYIFKNRVLTNTNVVVVVTLLTIMTYINYATFILIIGLCSWYLVSRWNSITSKQIVLGAASYTTLTAYQVFIFLNVHVKNKDDQISSILSSALNGAYGIVNGGSVFIVEPALVVFSIISFGFLTWGLFSFNTSKTKNRNAFFAVFVFLLINYMLFVILGIAGKYRNVIFLSLPFYFIVTLCLDRSKVKKINAIYLLTITLLTSQAYYNLLQHTNTGKGSYNLPISELITYLQGEKSEKKIIITTDPSINYSLKSQGFKVLYLKEFNNIDSLHNSIRNLPGSTKVYLIKTYPGSLSSGLYNDFINTFPTLCIKHDENANFGYDKYYKIKNKLPGNRPEVEPYFIQIEKGTLIKANICSTARSF